MVPSEIPGYLYFNNDVSTIRNASPVFPHPSTERCWMVKALSPAQSAIFLNEENIWTLKAVDLAPRPSGQGDSRDDRPISVPCRLP
ncbi:hypothetical protein CDAR_499081 [Caerostris darwini]|uniref:Uncharacterized protein n=1 Tax=Caerostris darwini TaxID=1538125 RepID=A0AAV4TNM2_9ARAC|nr:hypothetical protein CDAR_499081 [Caerostris darwini]